jgi:two-component system chemotaxis response regulator CheY
MRTIRSVLVIDDNPDTLETLATLLQSLGVDHVTQARSAEDALDTLKNQRFSLIVADYRLEGMDGVEFIEQLRAGGDLTPIIMLSGAPDKTGVIRATRQPKVDFFPKPFRVADFMGAMDRMAA